MRMAHADDADDNYIDTGSNDDHHNDSDSDAKCSLFTL